MAIPPIEELKILHNNICMAVGDPRRIQIMYALHEKPRYVSELAEDLEIPQPTISRHLSVLRQRSLVIAEREGAAMVYRLADSRIIDQNIDPAKGIHGLLRHFGHLIPVGDIAAESDRSRAVSFG